MKAAASKRDGGYLAEISFVPLPTRPMINMIISPEGMDVAKLRGHLRQRLSKLDPDSVVRLQIDGDLSETNREVLSAPHVRSLAPASMNISMAIHWRVRQAGR